MATGPNTSLHYAANGNFDSSGAYAPGVDGFNLADVGSVSELNSLPTGVKGLVYLGMTGGVTAAFTAAVDAYIGNPKLYGFYLADEPDGSATTAANLKAEADYIAAHVPGAVSYMTEQNLSANTTPSFYYTPANTDINLFGLDPYPIQTNVPNNLDYNIINLAVAQAEKVGIPLADIVPVYQAFGGGQYTTYILPTPAQEATILSTWASVVPNPAFDYAYSWGAQVGDTALANDAPLAAVFSSLFSSEGGTTPPPPPPGVPVVAISNAGGTVSVAAQTIHGTVDVADAGTSVTLFDGAVAVGTVVSNATTGAWSEGITLTSGANVLTATDTNSAGTGTSNAVDYTYSATAPPPPTVPVVTIANAGGTVSVAVQTIHGTVDVADAGTTVTLFDGAVVVGSTASNATTGAWSDSVTLNSGLNAFTATDTNSAGTGTSNAVDYAYSATTPPPSGTPPTVTIANDSLTVNSHGSVKLGISETAAAGETGVSVTITGLPRYETITDGLGHSFDGKSVTISEADVNSGLTLHSGTPRASDPLVSTLTVIGHDTLAGVISASSLQTMTITDQSSIYNMHEAPWHTDRG